MYNFCLPVDSVAAAKVSVARRTSIKLQSLMMNDQQEAQQNDSQQLEEP